MHFWNGAFLFLRIFDPIIDYRKKAWRFDAVRASISHAFYPLNAVVVNFPFLDAFVLTYHQDLRTRFFTYFPI